MQLEKEKWVLAKALKRAECELAIHEEDADDENDPDSSQLSAARSTFSQVWHLHPDVFNAWCTQGDLNPFWWCTVPSELAREHTQAPGRDCTARTRWLPALPRTAGA
jgi:hypothetical protein